MKRTLTLSRESLTDLTPEELSAVNGGIPTHEGPVCLVLNLLITVAGSECNTV